MRKTFLAIAALAAAVAAGSAQAETRSKVVYEFKAWRVLAVAWDDGTFACDAEVSEPGESLSIWADNTNPVKLQFYSTQWDFGSGDTADLEVQIDRRAPWTLNNADLYKNSILFNLPDSKDGTRFLLEVAKGNTLYLRTSGGRNIQSYTLAGSRASINALIDCVKALP